MSSFANRYNSSSLFNKRIYGAGLNDIKESTAFKTIRKWLTFIMIFILVVLIGVISNALVKISNKREAFETANNMSSRYPYAGPGRAAIGEIPEKVNLGDFEVENPNYYSKSLSMEPTNETLLGNQVWQFKPNPYQT